MTPEEIRALYVETLAGAMGRQETGNDWRQHGGEEVLERANLYADALAAAGLLPMQMQQHGKYHDNGRYDWRPTERRFLTEWREAAE